MEEGKLSRGRELTPTSGARVRRFSGAQTINRPALVAQNRVVRAQSRPVRASLEQHTPAILVFAVELYQAAVLEPGALRPLTSD